MGGSNPSGDTRGDLASEVAALQALKAEHAPILAQIAADPGMGAETRALLIAHLYEEEDERVARIAALGGGVGGGVDLALAEGGSTGPGPRPTALSVGSLRAPEPTAGIAPAASGLSVGSLRRDAHTAPDSRGSVGSLRYLG